MLVEYEEESKNNRVGQLEVSPEMKSTAVFCSSSSIMPATYHIIASSHVIHYRFSMRLCLNNFKV